MRSRERHCHRYGNEECREKQLGEEPLRVPLDVMKPLLHECDEDDQVVEDTGVPGESDVVTQLGSVYANEVRGWRRFKSTSGVIVSKKNGIEQHSPPFE